MRQEPWSGADALVSPISPWSSYADSCLYFNPTARTAYMVLEALDKVRAVLPQD
jgi:hypothetical protein